MEARASLVWSEAREGQALEGKVRVAIVESWATHWLVPHLRELHRRHPAIQVEILTGQQQSDLSRGEAEIAVRTPRPIRQELSAYRLARATVGLYAVRTLARRWNVDADPKNMPLLMYTPAVDFLQSAAWFRRLVERSEVRLTTNSTHALLAGACEGVGIAVLPRFIARRAPQLVSVSTRSTSEHELWLVSHPEFKRDPRVHAVTKFMKEIGRDLSD